MGVASGSAASPGGWSKRRARMMSRAAKGFRDLAPAVCLAWMSFAVQAAETPDEKKPGGPAGVPLGLDGLLEAVGGLLLVLVTIIALAWAARRYGRFPMAGKGLVNVLGGISVGSRERVVVVQVEDTRLVLGVAPGRIQTLHVLARAEEAEPGFDRALDVELRESRR